MPKTSYRVLQVADVLQRELATIVQQEVKNPSFGLLTISAVKLSKDLAYAKIFITFLNATSSKEEIINALSAKAPLFRNQLAKRIKLRIVPNLHFLFDETLAYGNHLTSLINADKAKNR